MHLSRSARVVAPVLLVVAVGCGDEKKSGGPSSSSASKSSSSAAASDKAPAKIELEEVKNDTLGVSILLPKGITKGHADEYGAVYTSEQIFVSMQVAPNPVSKEEDVLLGYVTEGMTFEKKSSGDLFMQIGSAPKEPKPVRVHASKKGLKVTALCTSVAELKDKAIEICSSLKAK